MISLVIQVQKGIGFIYRALINMPMPQKANELQQLLMATQWTSRSIPGYDHIVVNLQEIHEHSMKGQIKRTKSVAKNIN
jgi:hypothetical protein